MSIILLAGRITDLFRTTINVLSDSCGAALVARMESEDLEKIR